LVGTNNLICLTYVPLMGIGPLAGFIAALRYGAPTRPALAGAVAGCWQVVWPLLSMPPIALTTHPFSLPPGTRSRSPGLLSSEPLLAIDLPVGNSCGARPSPAKECSSNGNAITLDVPSASAALVTLLAG
jgi:hypothetical protein